MYDYERKTQIHDAVNGLILYCSCYINTLYLYTLQYSKSLNKFININIRKEGYRIAKKSLCGRSHIQFEDLWV